MSLSKGRYWFAVLSMLPLVSSAAEAPIVEQGRKVHQAVCMACHAPENVMVSAPKAGDTREWARRGAYRPGGIETLTNHAMDGFGAMPAKGGNTELTRAQIRDAIEFMRGGAPAGEPKRSDFKQ